MDVVGPFPKSDQGNKYVLIISDYFTRWTEAYPIPNQEAVTIAETLVKEYICRYGVPQYLHTDQGRNFESKLIKEVCELLGINETRTSPYHPQSDEWWNASTERWKPCCPSTFRTIREIGMCIYRLL